MKKLNRLFVFVLCLFALLGWFFAGFFYLESDALLEDCRGIIPAVQETADYYERVCSEDINRFKLWQLLKKNKDLNLLIKS